MTTIPCQNPSTFVLRMKDRGEKELISLVEVEKGLVTTNTKTIEYSCLEEGEIRKIFDSEYSNDDGDDGLDSDGDEGTQQSHWDTFHIEESFELATENGKFLKKKIKLI